MAKEKGEYIRAYKQSKRKDDDIAIVNAALRVSLDDDHTVKEVSLVYGGMAPTTIVAKKATEFLEGRKFTELQTLEGVMSKLEEDFDLRFGVPGGMATYRKTLALGFFYKFYHEVLAGLNAEEAEVVVVARAGESQEGGVGAWFACHDLHVEGLLVEGEALLEVGHEQHGVVETDGFDGHGAVPSGVGY